MDLIEQKDKLDILNVNVQIIKKSSKHGLLLPDTIRAIIVGPSGSGKINIMYNLIIHKNELRFENKYIYWYVSNFFCFSTLYKATQCCNYFKRWRSTWDNIM